MIRRILLLEALFLLVTMGAAPKAGAQELNQRIDIYLAEHVFHFASVSKPFVATAIMQLVEQEMMDLDDPVIKYLPYFRLADERYCAITIRQMLNQPK